MNATSNSINLTCEAVIASGSGSGFTVSQLKALSLDDIRDCLYELGYTPLDSDQATTIWNRVLAVYLSFVQFQLNSTFDKIDISSNAGVRLG